MATSPRSRFPIERAEFIICDLTNERPNVYYELGYAHGVGNEGADILLIAKEGTTLHFDIGPLRVQYYSSTEHLRTIISANLKQMIRQHFIDTPSGNTTFE